MKTEIPLKPENVLFTDEQWEAIHRRGSNLLISASAGSGKTMVLVNRIIEHVKKGVALDELLVVTFTNAAAKEMKQRIQEEIQNEINYEPEAEIRHHLLQQLPKLGHADISTLHSFCLKVIERFYYLIDFDPVFRQLTDETEIELIKEEVWDELLEELYQEADQDFIRFMEAYASDRNDDSVTKMVFELHNFARANEDPTKWLESLTDLYDIPGDDLAASDIYRKYLKQQLLTEIDFILDLINQALSLSNHEESLEKQIGIMSKEQRYYSQVKQYLSEDKLAELYALINFRNGGYTFETLRAPSKKTTPEEVLDVYNDEIKHLRTEAKGSYQKFENNFALAPEEQAEIINKTKIYVETLAAMTNEFSKRYQTYKSERKLVDFNDLEHLTLRILKVSEAGGEPEAAHYYRNKFKEVLVDEYQDINALQEAILLRLSNKPEETGNYFMVGDVKQSIYAFRLADPSLFIEKYNQYESTQTGERIILAENFRSRESVLSFVNYIFKQLMDYEVGNISYDEAAELVYGNPNFTEDKGFETEILIYETDNKDNLSVKEEDDIDEATQITEKSSGEIMMIASRVAELVQSGFEIYDKHLDEMRPIEYKDIVILTPTKMKNLKIQEIFQEAGLPIAINNTQNFFQTTEVTIMMSLLKIIDNPRQDIPLVATLRSPLVGLDEVELTYIRLQDKYADYYDAMLSYATAEFVDKRNIKLQKKVNKFIEQLNRWREYARRHSIVELLRLLYRETNYHHYVGGMSGGKQRRANLEALYERAASYEQTAFKGLYRFIRFIDKMQDRDKDLAEPTSIITDQNAVRVMTIHASKGLEFPVVFVADMSKRFNNADWTGQYVFDSDLGIGLEFRDPESRVKSATLIETAIKNKKKQNAYAEELRVLYVALTRAEQKLFLVGSKKTKEQAFEEWDKGNASSENVLPPHLRLSTNNYMDWIGLVMARHKKLENHVHSKQNNNKIKNYPVDFSYRFYNEAQIIEDLELLNPIDHEAYLDELLNGKEQVSVDETTERAVKEVVALTNYEYPYEISTETTNYQSVSEVKQLFEEPDDGKLARINLAELDQTHRYTEELLDRPKFLQETTQPTGSEIGQATHLLLQSIDLQATPTMESMADLLTRLVQEKIIKQETAQQIEIAKIVQFFQTSYGQEIIEHHEVLQKEALFSFMIKASDIFEEMEGVDDSILIHGIIDGFYERDDGFVLFDYKTDRVSHLGNNAREELLKRYKGQLLLYKQALETINKKEVVAVNIIALDIGETISVI